MILVTGGARSGKSSLAERLARERGGPVTYIATAEAGDGEMRERIARHRERRPESWRTVEAPENLPDAVAEALGAGCDCGGAGAGGEAGAGGAGLVLIDCLTVYISNLLVSQGIASSDRAGSAIDREVDRLVEICAGGNGRVIMVSNEVGMGIVPDNRLARVFRDAAGRANQKLAEAAEEVYLCVSGIPLKVK